MNSLTERAAENLEAVRKHNPLIHNITNYVVMNSTANALLALGASPVMAHALEEVEEMAGLAGALVLNIGTLSPPWVKAMIAAGKRASERKIPVVLDPVGAGATQYRTRAAKEIIEKTHVTIIRGNASEILALGYGDSGTKGVDAVHSVEEASKTAGLLARKLGATLAITGPTDLVTGNDGIYKIKNGHPMMTRVTGTGCTATAIIAAFSAVDKNPARAAATALAFYGLAGEVAALKAAGPGGFQGALLDALYALTPEMLCAQAQYFIGGLKMDYSVYLVTDRSLARGRAIPDIVAAAIRGGATCVQLREKTATTREFIDQALAIRALLARFHVPLIINDRVDVALAVNADGIHLGQKDMPCKMARRILPRHMIIGISAESVDDAVRAQKDGADYLGVSPVFSTPTKTDTAPPLGLEGLRSIRSRVALPLVGIGGLNLKNAETVIQNGADGVAVVSSIVSAHDPEKAASGLAEVVKRAKQKRKRLENHEFSQAL